MVLNYIPDGKSSSMSSLQAKIDPSKIAKSTGDVKNKKGQQPATDANGEEKKPSKKDLKKAAKKEQKQTSKAAAKETKDTAAAPAEGS